MSEIVFIIWFSAIIVLATFIFLKVLPDLFANLCDMGHDNDETEQLIRWLANESKINTQKEDVAYWKGGTK